MAVAATSAAAADPSSDGADGPFETFSRVATTLTSLFPVFVLGAAVWALARPAAFAWFDRSAITPALAVTMLGSAWRGCGGGGGVT